jgi:hypothetical protein
MLRVRHIGVGTFFPRLENRETWGTPSSGSANENRVDMVRGMWATRHSPGRLPVPDTGVCGWSLPV